MTPTTTPRTAPLCMATTQKGQPCPINAMPGQSHCHVHGSAAERASAGLKPLPMSKQPKRAPTNGTARPITDEDLDAVQRQIHTLTANAHEKGQSAKRLTMLMAMGDVQAMIDRIRSLEP